MTSGFWLSYVGLRQSSGQRTTLKIRKTRLLSSRSHGLLGDTNTKNIYDM